MKRQENHDNEQYFFDGPTLQKVADLVECFEHPCLLCAPMVGQVLAERGKQVPVLDIDDRFADLPGFKHWNLSRPAYVEQKFDFILCDPPFFNVSLRELRQAIRVLAHFNTRVPVMISYPVRRREALMRVFSDFDLKPTGFRPTYATVEASERNDIEFFANFELPE